MNTDLVCREAIPADADRLVAFQLALAWETESLRLDPATCARGVGAVFGEPALGRYFVVDLDGEVVGALLITREWSDWRDGEVWWIQSVYVVPHARGQGVFKRLHAHIKSIAASDERVHGLRLYVDKRNAAAQSVYAKLGMNGDHYQVFEWMKKF